MQKVATVVFTLALFFCFIPASYAYETIPFRNGGRIEGIEVKSTLLAGKAYDEIYKYLGKEPAALLVAGRFGAHKTEEQDIGNTAENLLRLAPCNLLITGGSPAA